MRLANLENWVRARLGASPLYFSSLYHSFSARSLLDEVETYCLFVGYPRSGHTLTGSLLDAHPDAIIGHGVDALKYVKMGFGKHQLFYLLLDNSRSVGQQGRQHNQYSYVVPNQWQGKVRRLKVIGDKRGGLSTRALAANPTLLGKLRRTVGVKVKMIHVIRNPFDNIATICRRRADHDLRSSVDEYFGLCRRIVKIRAGLNESDMFDMRLEALIEDPQDWLARCCRFLNLEVSDRYLEDCAGIVYRSPHQSRYEVEWSPELIGSVVREMERYPQLAGYTY